MNKSSNEWVWILWGRVWLLLSHLQWISALFRSVGEVMTENLECICSHWSNFLCHPVTTLCILLTVCTAIVACWLTLITELLVRYVVLFVIYILCDWVPWILIVWVIGTLQSTWRSQIPTSSLLSHFVTIISLLTLERQVSLGVWVIVSGNPIAVVWDLFSYESKHSL